MRRVDLRVLHTEINEVFRQQGMDSGLRLSELHAFSRYRVPLFSTQSVASDVGNLNKNILASTTVLYMCWTKVLMRKSSEWADLALLLL
jgi:hypothetical protein